MGSREVQSSTWVPPRGVFSQSTRRPAHWRPGASSQLRGPFTAPGASWGSPATAPDHRHDASGPAMLSDHTGNQGRLVRDLDIEAGGITRQQATSPETLQSPELPLALWHCHQTCPASLHCTLGPLLPRQTQGCPLPALPRCPLCEKLGVGESQLQARARVCPSQSQSPFEGAGDTGDHPMCWLK